jgi:hypothetical protein
MTPHSLILVPPTAWLGTGSGSGLVAPAAGSSEVSTGAGGCAWFGQFACSPVGWALRGLLVADTPGAAYRAAVITTNNDTRRAGTDLLAVKRTRAE